MLNNIAQHIALVDNSITWAKEFGKEAFPFELFKNYRRRLRRIQSALEGNCSAAAYGESQVGKSYLMSSLLSSPDAPFVITNAGESYSFIDKINPSGGNNTEVESTGVITRFTMSKGESVMKDYVKVRNLSVVDIILLLADSYYNDIKIDPDTVLRYDDINSALEGMSPLWASKEVVQNEISEDDIRDIVDYMHDVIGNAAAGVNQSRFCEIVAPIIQYVSFDKWVEIFGLLWNNNKELSRLFCVLINEYKRLNFQTEVYVPFEAVLRDKGTLLKIEWLDTVCGVQIDTGRDEIYTDVYDLDGNVLARNFHKGYLSALIAELTFELSPAVANERKFLHKLDLLDFPGARSREKYKEQEIEAVLPKMLRRGKVAYLFNKYSRSLKISSVLFCHHNRQKAEATIGETINNWIESNIGSSPEERAAMLNNTNGIAPLFLIATKFNIDLERTKNDNPSTIDKLDEHWKRFDTVLPEIIKPDKWLDEWVKPGGLFTSSAFQNIYPLRDFFWSGKNGVFDGYSDGDIKSEEKCVHVHHDYEGYFEDLKASFLENEFVKRHFACPEQTWNDVATINNDGSKAIIRNLDSIAGVLDDARKEKYLAELKEIEKEMRGVLYVYFEPEDKEEKNRKLKQIVSSFKIAITLKIGKKPELFGQIIDNLMVPVGDLRAIAYNIIVCHTEVPKDLTWVIFVRKMAGISSLDNKETVIKKLFAYFDCDDLQTLEKILSENGCSVEEIVAGETDIPTTESELVTKHIIDYWNNYIGSRAKVLEPILPYSDEVVFMLSSLLNKMGLKSVLSETIEKYTKQFNIDEQPNAIADFAALTLNNFVSSVGRNYINDKDVEIIRTKAEKCHISIDLGSSNWNIERKPQSVLEVFDALEKGNDIAEVPKEVLMTLPFYSNYMRWINLVTIGFLYASDISNVDPVANARIKKIIDDCDTLYR